MKGLALEGGGVLGAAQAGMLYELYQKNNLSIYPADKWKVVSGTSIGAFNGLLVALRYTYNEIFEIWSNIKQKDLLDRKFSIFIKSYSRKPMIKFLENLIKEKLNVNKITFSELYNETGVDLICTGSVVQTGKILLFGKDFIDYDVVTAIMMSTAHPGMFEPVEYIDPKDNKTYQIIDGGVLTNSPILPLYIKKCNKITVLSLGDLNQNFEFKGPIRSLDRLLEFITVGNELVSLAWASSVCENIEVYRAPCQDVKVLDFSKIKSLLFDGMIAIQKGKVNPNDLIFQFNLSKDYKTRIKIK